MGLLKCNPNNLNRCSVIQYYGSFIVCRGIWLLYKYPDNLAYLLAAEEYG